MSDKQEELPFDKGGKMEELLRNYFLELGFYVVRGLKYKYQGFDITDVDLFLYNRPTIVTRERINVDIKNKKTPAAIERIFWAAGLRDALRFDNCIVATTDKRPSVREFGLKNNVTVLDGSLLSKLQNKVNENRFTEEEFLNLLVDNSNGKLVDDWRKKYEEAKSQLLIEMDFSGCNSKLRTIKHLFESVLTNPIRREIATRLIYVNISHLLIILDYLNKETAFLDHPDKLKKLEEGLKYGNLGQDGISRTVNLAVKLTGQKGQIEKMVKQVYDRIPIVVLTEFIAKAEVSKSLFKMAKEFEANGYARTFVNPNSLTNELQSVIAVLLDFNEQKKKKFFSVY